MKLLLTLFILSLVVLISCGPSRRVTRTAADETIDLSGRWNDTDSRLVSDEAIKDCLQGGWLTKFMKKSGKNPAVIVGTVRNRSTEHISTETFTKDLERSLVNSGQVDFVADSGQREEIREERKEQLKNASDATAKGPGQEIGADFMIKGQINTILDEAGGERVVFYQVELELIDVATNQKAWIFQKKIKKLVERKGSSW